MDQPTSLAFLTNENPPKEFNVPLHLARQCKTFQNAFEDISSMGEQKCIIPHALTKDVLLFITYLEKIHEINVLPQCQENTLKNLNTALSKSINTLDTPTLITLAHSIDQFDVTNNHHFIQTLANRIIQTPIAQRTCFNSLGKTPLFQSVMRKVSEETSLEAKLLQSYLNTLPPTLPQPKIESHISWLYNKILSACSPATHVTKPYYFNSETGTIITGHTEEMILAKYSVTLCLTILKKGQQPFIINTKYMPDILHIDANADESLFICRRPINTLCINILRTCIINPRNVKKPILTGFDICEFTQNGRSLYVVENGMLGILNLENGQFTPIELNTPWPIKGIHTNKTGTTVVVFTDHKIFLGKKHKDGLLIFKELDTEQIKKIIGDWVHICHVHLHPTENLLYLATQTIHNNPSYIVHLEPLKIIPLPEIAFSYRLPHETTFISDNILLLGGTSKEDCFFNLKTHSFWIKEKKPNSCRLAFTSDYKNSIEETTFSYKSHPYKKIKFVPLFDDTMISASKHFSNKGSVPLSLLNIAQTDPGSITLAEDDYNSYKQQPQDIQTIVDASYIVMDTTLQSQLKGILLHIQKTLLPGPIKTTAILASCAAMYYMLHKFRT